MASQIEQKKTETGSSELWMLSWVLKAHAMEGVGLPLPMPYELQYFAPITQAFPLTSSPAQLYRYEKISVLPSFLNYFSHEIFFLIGLFYRSEL